MVKITHNIVRSLHLILQNRTPYNNSNAAQKFGMKLNIDFLRQKKGGTRHTFNIKVNINLRDREEVRR